MSENWTEGKLEFDLAGARNTEKPDEHAAPLKSVDFLAQYPGVTWLIEVKDPEGAPPEHQVGAAKAVFKEIHNDSLLKEHLLPKLYGAFAYMVMTGREPRGRVRYAVLIGLQKLTAEDRQTLTNGVQRVVDRIGPKIRYGHHWPTVEVHNVASWNVAHPTMTVKRHP